MWFAALGLAILLATGCGGSSSGRPATASEAVAQYASAIEANDARRAYALLSSELRSKMTFERFESQWRAHAAERKLQAAALVDARKADSALGARAIVSYKDGSAIALTQESSQWHLERALVGRVVAATPRDAIRSLTRALSDTDFAAFVGVLSKRKREALVRMLSSFSESLTNNQDQFIQRVGDDRAQMIWEDRAGRYRVLLVREDGQWRIDDFDIALNESEEEDGDDSGAGKD